MHATCVARLGSGARQPLQLEIVAKAFDYCIVMRLHFLVAPFLVVAGDLRHLLQLGTLDLDRGLEVLSLGSGQAVTKL